MATRVTIKPRKQNINVTSTPKNRIQINTGGGVGGGGVNQVDTIVELHDVDATHLVDNETLVYNAASGKFVVEELPVINGGEF